jgi:hypothetical protein
MYLRNLSRLPCLALVPREADVAVVAVEGAISLTAFEPWKRAAACYSCLLLLVKVAHKPDQICSVDNKL